MSTLVSIQGVRVFSLEEAQEILPVIQKITKEVFEKAERLSTRLKMMPEGPFREGVQWELDQIVEHWKAKIQKLGARPQGIWIADFDFGQGYFCWKFPETRILYWHGYEDGFTNRRPIQQLTGEQKYEDSPLPS